MSLLPDDLLGLDYDYLGLPYAEIPSFSLISLSGFDYDYLGLPFFGPDWTLDKYGLEYDFRGQPYLDTPAGADINLLGLEYAYQGLPFVAPSLASAITTGFDPFGMMGMFGV